jgi:hypothetical protein
MAGKAATSQASAGKSASLQTTTGHGILLPPPDVIPHTLILGTHPSVESLSQAEYYGKTSN